MIVCNHQHEAVLVKRESLERAGFDGACDDTDIGNTFRDQTHDLVGKPFF